MPEWFGRIIWGFIRFIRIDSTLENYTYIDKVDGLEIMYSVLLLLLLLFLLLLSSFKAVPTWSQFTPNIGELAVHTTPNQIDLYCGKRIVVI